MTGAAQHPCNSLAFKHKGAVQVLACARSLSWASAVGVQVGGSDEVQQQARITSHICLGRIVPKVQTDSTNKCLSVARPFLLQKHSILQNRHLRR